MEVSELVVLDLAASLQHEFQERPRGDRSCAAAKLHELLQVCVALAPVWRSADPEAGIALSITADTLATVLNTDQDGFLGYTHVELQWPVSGIRSSGHV